MAKQEKQLDNVIGLEHYPPKPKPTTVEKKPEQSSLTSDNKN
ncbi:hypothetical protein [Gilliamella sp. Fer1-1]|nr:hypothetical protein [Gilliamella apicola]